jgi:hypothetical protein
VNGTARRWPLFLIAAPAAVAVWSGWVGLGGMCGFGLVQPLPGIVAWHLNTAITLPVGVESYGAYALGAWLTPGTPERAKGFARNSAIGALSLGVLGQVAYHLLAAAHAHRAPWPVVILVSCLPVITLGFGAALTHLLRVPDADEDEAQGEPGKDETVDFAGMPEDEPRPVLVAVPSDAIEAAKASMRTTTAAGNPWSVNQLTERFSLTRSQATKVRREVLAEANGHEAIEEAAG